MWIKKILMRNSTGAAANASNGERLAAWAARRAATRCLLWIVLVTLAVKLALLAVPTASPLLYYIQVLP
jgi:hypothetical protein